MRSKKSTIGGAFSALGKSLMGIGGYSAISALSNPVPTPLPEFILYLWMAGFVLDGLGAFFASLFAADRSDVKRLFEESEDQTDTKLLTKQDVEEK